MAGAGPRKGRKDDNGIGTAIDFVLSNARLVLGVGGAAMLGIATLAVKRVSEPVGAVRGQLSRGIRKTQELAVGWVRCKCWALNDSNCAWWCRLRCTTVQSVLPAAPLA